MTKEELALEIIERLKKEYPDADCTLDYDEAWKLLVSVRLAAQCTDARVNVVVEDLYAKFPDIDALAEASVDDIEAKLSIICVRNKVSFDLDENTKNNGNPTVYNLDNHDDDDANVPAWVKSLRETAKTM